MHLCSRGLLPHNRQDWKHLQRLIWDFRNTMQSQQNIIIVKHYKYLLSIFGYIQWMVCVCLNIFFCLFMWMLACAVIERNTIKRRFDFGAKRNLHKIFFFLHKPIVYLMIFILRVSGLCLAMRSFNPCLWLIYTFI